MQEKIVILVLVLSVLVSGCVVDINKDEEDAMTSFNDKVGEGETEIEVFATSWEACITRISGENKPEACHEFDSPESLIVRLDDARRSITFTLQIGRNATGELRFNPIEDKDGLTILFPFHVTTVKGSIKGSSGQFHKTSGEYLVKYYGLGPGSGLITIRDPVLQFRGDESGNAVIILSSPVFDSGTDPVRAGF